MSVFHRFYDVLRAQVGYRLRDHVRFPKEGETPKGKSEKTWHENTQRSWDHFHKERDTHQDPPSSHASNDPIAEHYAALELPYGADWSAVQKARRDLLRKYHPDLHSADPKKLDAATEVAQAINHAYRELKKHLNA